MNEPCAAVVRLQMRGVFDIANKDELSALLLPGETADVVVIDMTDTEYVDSSALHCLVHLKTRLLAHDGVVQLVGVHPNIQRVLSVTGLDGLFEISA